MKRNTFITFLCIFPLIILAQRDLDSISITKDFQIFENILYKGHPSLYEYTSKDSLDNVIHLFKDSISYLKTDIDLYKKMLEVTDLIKDGHLNLFAPNTIKSEYYHFPLILKIIGSNFYTDTEDFGIPIGSRITKINDKLMDRILEKLKKYVPVDGFNTTKKYREIESKFGLFYAYEYGLEKEFHIEYLDPTGSIKTINLEAESFSKVKLRNAKRRSYFAKYHKQADGIIFFDQHIDKKEPFVYYNPQIQTATLVVNTFKLDTRSFQTKLSQIFKDINKRKIQNLIIDIRNNNGGYRPNAIYLYSYIANNSFKQRNSEFVASLSIPERKYAVRVTKEDELYLKTKFFNHPQIDGWKINYDDMQTIMVPDKEKFEGKVYVLASGTTFSTGATFALNIKNDPKILLVGEETGGGYYFHTSDFPVYYKFPNSGIMMRMSLSKSDHYVIDTTIPRGSGIPVDRYIPLTINDLINGKDPQLDYVIKLIRGNSSAQ